MLRIVVLLSSAGHPIVVVSFRHPTAHPINNINVLKEAHHGAIAGVLNRVVNSAQSGVYSPVPDHNLG